MKNMPRQVVDFTRLLFLGFIITCIHQNAFSQSRSEQTQHFHRMAQQPTGLLIPLYIYPADIHKNAEYNRVMDLKRRYRSVPFWVIVNPDSGPGTAVDANYTKAIDRLIGAGCVVLGYVSTDYSKRTSKQVEKQMEDWQRLYPRTQGIFFDEMVYQDNSQSSEYQSGLNQVANKMGFWPTVANPGTDTPERYFKSPAADVIVVHESNQWPTESKLHGDFFGGYSDYPPFSRAVLVYGQPKLNAEAVKLTSTFAGFIYVTNDRYTPKNPAEPNPWDTIPEYLEDLCRVLSSVK